MSAPETILLVSAVEHRQGVSGVGASGHPSEDNC